MTARLLITSAQAGTQFTLAPEQAHYLVDVRRLRVGDSLEVFDGRGGRFAARLAQAQRRGAQIEIGEQLAPAERSPLRVTLAQGLASGDRMDWVIEKSCELGVDRIVPLTTERSTVRLDAQRAERRLAHWRRIAEAACMQSGRDTLPEVEPPQSLANWLAQIPPSARRLTLSPRAEHRLSQTPIDASHPIIILVGPESGLSESEIESATQHGFESVRIGSRILRTETAGLAALAALQAIAGDF